MPTQACEVCPVAVCRKCFKEVFKKEPGSPWQCRIHDEHQPVPPILLYDVVWCKRIRRPWRLAVVVPFTQTPPVLQQVLKLPRGTYGVLLFRQDASGQKYAFLPAERLLPFEEHHTTDDFWDECVSEERFGIYLRKAIEFFSIISRVRLAINGKTFEMYSPFWQYINIHSNEATDGTHYVHPAHDHDQFINVAVESPDTTTEMRRTSRRNAAIKCIENLKALRGTLTVNHCACIVRCDPAVCANAISEYECSAENCTLFPSVACENQRLADLHKPPGSAARYADTVMVCTTPGKGKGLFARRRFLKGSYIIEYTGEIISKKERKHRETFLLQNYNFPMFYFVSLDTNRIIDAQRKGNVSRFANHSCAPNTDVKRVFWAGDIHVVFVAKRDIYPGEEITFSYNWGTAGKNPTTCMCGEEGCSRIVGAKRTSAKENEILHPTVSLVPIGDAKLCKI